MTKKSVKGGDKTIETNSPISSTFNILIKNNQKSLYVKVDGSYLKAIYELNGKIYGLPPWGDYYKLDEFSYDGNKLQYNGDKLKNNTIILTTNNNSAKKENKSNIINRLKEKETIRNLTNSAKTTGVTAGLNVADAASSMCVIC
jgi:hypothetical protein